MNGEHVFLAFCDKCGKPQELSRNAMKKNFYIHCKNCKYIKNMPKHLRELADEI